MDICIRWLLSDVSTSFYDCISLSVALMKEEQTMWQFYKHHFMRILPPFFIFMLLYSTLSLLWGQIDGDTSVKDLSWILFNFPTLAGHLWFMYPLISLYLFIPVILLWLRKVSAKEECFLSVCSCCQHVYFIWTVFQVKCGDNVSGMNTVHCGISPVI